MFRPDTALRSVLLVPLLLGAVVAVALGAGDRPRTAEAAIASQRVAGQYIVTLRPGQQPSGRSRALALAYGFGVRHVYANALRGFSATIPDAVVARLRADPAVLSIVEDRRVRAVADARPSGVRRSQADRNALAAIGSGDNPIAVDVAVIDSGVDVDHPDLNVVGGVNCVPGETSYDDQNGHGTHVAGTIGALDNGTGVVGVAPGARIWAVRVLNAAGEGSYADVICGLDWVTANAGTIDVANMSLGGPDAPGSCLDGSLRQAVCSSVAAGVPYVVAAGNDGVDAGGFVPASFDEVITVSAIADTDGRPGGRESSSFFYGADDTLATFSNYGAVVDIAAPGVNIVSTWPGGGTFTTSGTSMASPHVAGAAAVYRYQIPGATPAQIKGYLQGLAWGQGSADGFTGDRDAFAEGLLNAGAVGGLPLLPEPTASCALDQSGGVVGATVRVTCANFDPSESVRVYWESTATPPKAFFMASSAGAGTTTFRVPDATAGPHAVIVQGMGSGREVALSFAISPSLTVSGSSGKVGSFAFATLKGYAANEPVEVRWFSTPTASALVKTVTASAVGSASVGFAIPEATKGSHAVEGVGTGGGGTASAPYTVVPGVTLTPSSGRVGAMVTVSLRGFAAGETATVRWFDTATSATSATEAATAPAASALGSATVSFVVPAATRGAHVVEAVGSAESQATASYTVSPSLTLSPATTPVGGSTVVTLRGYGASETVELRWYDTSSSFSVLGSVTTDGTGGAAPEIEAPEATKGLHLVEGATLGGAKATAYATVQSGMSLAPTAGAAGSQVDVTLTGFGAANAITVKWYAAATSTINVATATASATGSATASFAVPESRGGTYKVEAIAGGNKASTTFTVTSTTPPPTCAAAPATGPVGTSVTVTCANVKPAESVRLYWDDPAGSQRAFFTASATGGGSGTFWVPDAMAGMHNVIAVASPSGEQAIAAFAVTPSVTLSQETGAVGAGVSATLKGYAAGETVEVRWYDSATVATVVKSATASASGGASAFFTVPSTTQGVHAVEATGLASGGTAGTTFTVKPGVRLSPTGGKVGAGLMATADGYAAGELVELRWYDTATTFTVIGAATPASSSGKATFAVAVPEGTRGGHKVEAAGDRGNVGAATYTVSPSVAPVPMAGTVGATFTVTLRGYAAGEVVTLRWYDTTTSFSAIGSPVTTSASGSAAVSLTAPEATRGMHKVEGVGGTSGAVASSTFTINPSVALSPISGQVGAAVGVTLTGFGANETVNVRWYQTAFAATTVASPTSTDVGTVAASFTVPAANPGAYKVEAIGTKSFARIATTFTVEAAASGGLGATAADPPAPATPTLNEPFGDDFEANRAGVVPAGWVVAEGSAAAMTVATVPLDGGTQVAMGATGSEPGAAWLIRDGARFERPDVAAELRVERAGGVGGVVLAWNGPNDYVAVNANPETDALELWEVAGGAIRTTYATAPGGVPIELGRQIWVRAAIGADAAGTWVSLAWSSDGRTYQRAGAVEGLANVAGGVGLMAAGVGPVVLFDDVVAWPSTDSARPASLQPQPAAPGVEPSASSAPDATVVEPTATVPSEPPPATPTPEPPATPTPEAPTVVPADPPVDPAVVDPATVPEATPVA